MKNFIRLKREGKSKRCFPLLFVIVAMTVVVLNLFAAPALAAPERKEIVFIENSLDDYQMLAGSVKPGMEVHVLDSTKDGLVQMAEILEGHSGIDAIHIIAHGAPGKVYLGKAVLSAENMENYELQLGAIGKSIRKDGDLLIYGCNVAKGGFGEKFINLLAKKTNADIAASGDLTGNKEQSGNWDLEYSVGTIEKQNIISVESYSSILGIPANGTYSFANAHQNSADGTATTEDNFFIIDRLTDATHTSGVNADGAGAFISSSGAVSEQYSTYLEVKVNGAGSFYLTNASIGEFTSVYDTESQKSNTQYRNVYLVGYANGSEVYRTSSSNTLGINNYLAEYNIDYSICCGHLIDKFRVYFTVDAGSLPSCFNLANFTLQGASATPVSSNTAPSFIGGTTTLTVAQNAAATNIKSLLHVSDTDSSQTLTWSQATATNHGGTLTISSATAASGTADITPGGTLTYAPAAGYSGTETFTVQVSDGTATATRQITVTVVPPPTVSSVSATSPNGTYKAGDTISISVNFSGAVNVAGTPQITLETGATDRVVNYSSGTGTSTLTFIYTVQAGDTSSDLDYTGTAALALNSGTIKDAAGNNAVLTLPIPGAANSLGANKAIVIDTIPPSGYAVTIDQSVINNSNRSALSFTFSGAETGTAFNYTVTSSGGAGSVSGSGTISGGAQQVTGVDVASLPDGNLTLSVTLTDVAGNTGAAVTASKVKDATAPTLTIGSPSATLIASASITYTITYTGADSIALANGNVTLNRTGTANGTVNVSAATANTKTVTISAITGNGTLGISIAAGTASDTAGNSAAAAGPSTTFTVDNTAPTLTIGSPSATLTASASITYTITYTGADSIALANGNVTLNRTGTANGTVNVSAATANTKTVTISTITGDGTLGISIAAGTASDTAGNTAAAAGPSATFAVDNTAPTGTLRINSDDPYMTDTNMSFSITGSDTGGSGLYQMRFQVNGGSWSSWESFNTTKTCSTPISYGTVTVSMQLKDNAGNTSGSITDTILYKSIPSTSGTTKNGTEDTTMPFAVSDFVYSNSDGSELTKVRIVSLPSNGSLKLNHTNISELQEIDAADLTSITFVPHANWNGSTAFNWMGYDGTLWSSQATIDLNLSPDSDTAASSTNNTLSLAHSRIAAGGTVTITSSGDRQSADGLVIGDEKYIPATWNSTETGKSGSFTESSGTYTSSYPASAAGTYTITVTYQKQMWNGTSWENGTTDTKTIVLEVYATANPAGNSVSISPGSFVVGETATITASGNRQGATAISIGDERYTPLSWTSSEAGKSGTFTSSGNVYSSSYTTTAAGAYTITVTYSKQVWNGTAWENSTTDTKTATLTVNAPSSGGGNGGGGGGGATNTTNPPTIVTPVGVEIQVNGKSDTAGTAASSTNAIGQTVTTISVDSQKVEQKLSQEGNNAVVTIPVDTKTDVVVGELNGQIVKAMETKQAVLEVKTEVATYTLPAAQINIAAVSAQIGTQVKLQDIKVSIEIAKAGRETERIVENAAKAGEFTIVAPPVEFTVKCTSGEKTVSVSSFNAYVERTVAIPAGIDPSKITTGVVVDPDGTTRHVPTRIVQIDGKYYAKINSLSNSTYSVIYSPKKFKDVTNHWAEEAINDMGSRLIISGIDTENFAPDRDITRAEFAAIVVRALGLKPGNGKTPFTDVAGTAWYSGYIITASEYGIISGYGNNKFGPMDKITHEQAMTMISRAMKITKLKVAFKADEIKTLLERFGDSKQSASWAKEGIAECVKAGITTSENGNMLKPKVDITRAEVAVIIRKLLIKSNLI